MVRVSGFPLSRRDILFLLETIDPKLVSRLDTFMGDPQIIERMLDNESASLFQRLMDPGEATTSVTPRLLFEVLLREAARGIPQKKYTVERMARHRIPVFDTAEVAGFLANRSVLRYLADMLSSFTKVDSHTLQVRAGKGIWRKASFSDMDLNSLKRLCRSASEGQRFAYYKRAADLCLFTLGMFPESVGPRPADSLGPVPGDHGLRAEDYEEEGKRYYKLACEHKDAQALDLADVLALLHNHFVLAKKPLNYISDNFARFKRAEGAPPDAV